ncbi:phosphoglycolate phosphatase [Motiliproteus sediminis]|uniref:phosphoglycolate phosphatase n=1 Tax=Motiliproteus sediminis TaxID=1468178 RepID=UPI001AEF9E4A|nr:phosphoglycolate phosphatase [Motiliproteus sediminis]
MSPFSTLPPEAVLFDLDGTLVDSVPSLAAAVDRTLAALGRPQAGVDKVRDWVGNGAQKLVERALAGNREALPAPAADQVEDALALFLEFYGEQPEVGTRLYPGVSECLQQLSARQVPMAVVTNKPERFVPPLLDSFGIDGHFALVLGGDSLATKKPHPAPLQHAAEHFGVAPERCLMVGDSMTDVRAARAAGMPVACVSYGYNHGTPISEAGADWTVDSLTELL